MRLFDPSADPTSKEGKERDDPKFRQDLLAANSKTLQELNTIVTASIFDSVGQIPK